MNKYFKITPHVISHPFLFPREEKSYGGKKLIHAFMKVLRCCNDDELSQLEETRKKRNKWEERKGLFILMTEV